MEKGKTSKYLKYAIGEIILVVIGILIALQINNWNEKQKSYNLETKLLNEMKTSIERDIGRTNGLLGGRAKVKRKSIATLLDNLLGEEEVADTVLLRDFFSSTLTLSFSYDKGPYESLKSVGLDKITNDSLRGKIVRFYEVTLPLAVIFVDYNKDIHNNKRAVLKERLFDKYYEKEDGKWTIKNSTNFEVIKRSKDFKELIYMEQHVADNYIGRLERVKSQLQNMLSDLNTELVLRQ